MSATPWPIESNPLGVAVPNAIVEALAERMHACNGGYSNAQMKYMRVPTASAPFSFSFCQQVQRALLGMIPRFINMDFDYASDDWMSFPKMYTLHDVCSVEDRNIMLMPPQYGTALNVAAWYVKACNVLDMLRATLPVAPVLAFRQVTGFGIEYDSSLSAAIAVAHTYDVTDQAYPGGTTIGRKWDLSITRRAATGEDDELQYRATFVQNYSASWRNPSPLTPIPVIVACWFGNYTDPAQNAFNALGTDWVEGLNPLPVFEVDETRVIDNDSSILDPSPVPTLATPPAEINSSTDFAVGYRLVPYLDWFSEGGFKYQPDSED